MKCSSNAVFAALVALVIGLVLGTAVFTNHVVAQSETPKVPNRYQISAYAGPTRDGFGHGCYILDTQTGQIWHARVGGEAEKVSGVVK